jgi:hypothetical protein
MNQSQQQIANETVDELNPKTDGERVTFYNIILSAIERATELVPDGMLSGGVQKMDAAAQPQRSEQEWTEERIEDLLEEGGEYGKSALLVAINAALTAERQRREQSEEKNSAQVNTFRLLGDALGISPQNEFTDELFVAVANLKGQLLSALAAIEEIKNWILRITEDVAPTTKPTIDELEAILTDPRDLKVTILPTGEVRTIPDIHAAWCKIKQIVTGVDLSLLHKHDTEVRKPLVDALESVRDFLSVQPNHHPEIISEIDEAMAKVK